MRSRGINLPWMRYGGDFGANAWAPDGGLSRRPADVLDALLGRAADAGAEVIRWFILCDGRAGLDFDPQGVPVALQPRVLDDFAAALAALQRHGLRMVPVLFDFTWADARREVHGVQLGGRAAILRDPVSRHHLWRAVTPLLLTFGRHPAVALWDLWNEPEWMAAPWRPPARRLTTARVAQLLGELALIVRWHTTQPITAGLASARGLPLCRALDLDVLQVHWYDHLERRAPLAPCPRVGWSRAPLVLGEFPTRGSARPPAAIAAAASRAGYEAAWPWSLHAEDTATNADLALQAITHDSEGLQDSRR